MELHKEDALVNQMEMNLTNRNENLFQTGRTESNQLIPRKENALIRTEDKKTMKSHPDEYPLVSNESIMDNNVISRAEYIRQARESCLRQLSNVQLYSRPYDVNYMEPDNSEEALTTKKANVMRLFSSDMSAEQSSSKTNEQQLATYRSMIIRCVCAIVLFLGIFAFDKSNIELGGVTKKVVQEYVTGNDILQDLQNTIVSWLK